MSAWMGPLLQKLGYLTRGMSVADFAPTDQDLEVQEILRALVDDHLEALEALVSTDVRALNEKLRSRGLLIIADGQDR